MMASRIGGEREHNPRRNTQGMPVLSGALVFGSVRLGNFEQPISVEVELIIWM